MRTIKLIPVILLVISTFVSCNDDETYNGSGNLITEERNLETFTKIESSGVFEIDITQSSEQKVEVTADDNIIGNLITTVSNGTLKVYLKDGNYNHIDISLTIAVNELIKISNEGTGIIEAEGFFDNDKVDIFNSGSGRVYYEGTTLDLTIDNVGSGEVDCMDLASKNANVYIEGSGDSYVSLENELKGKIEGSGSIYYKGTPSVDVQIEGSGQVIKMD